MNQPQWTFGSMGVEMSASGVGNTGGPAQPVKSQTFRLLVVGDFSGRDNQHQHRSSAELAKQRAVEIDRDNFDDVLRSLAPTLNIALGQGESHERVQFAELDDFHPDRLFQSMEVFSHLRALRRRLENPRSSQEAADEVRQWGAQAEARQSASKDTGSHANTPDQGPPVPASDADLLDQIVGGAVSVPKEADADQAEGSGPGTVDWKQLVAEIVEPYVIRTDPDLKSLVAQVDQAISGQMAKVLHQPAFQALEAAWRGLFFLTRRLPTDRTLKVFLWDASRSELFDDLQENVEALEKSGLSKALVDAGTATMGGKGWNVMVGDFAVHPTQADAEFVGRWAQIAQRAGGALLLGAHSSLAGCPSFALSPDPDDWNEPIDPAATQAWTQLRQHEVARWVGLSAPRLILGLPYGQSSFPIEEFHFEEFAEQPPEHEGYLWGQGSWAVATVLGLAFSRTGWTMSPQGVVDLPHLPAHIYHDQGEAEMKPCAEALLAERAANALVSAGLIPLLSYQGQDAVRVGRLTSVSSANHLLTDLWQ